MFVKNLGKKSLILVILWFVLSGDFINDLFELLIILVGVCDMFVIFC